MKLVVLKKNLKDGLRVIEQITKDDTDLPILKNFLIESFDNRIKLSATNLELAVISFISGKIIENGGITIPFGIFNSIINNLQNERINIEINNNKILLKTDNYEAEINGIKKEDFPIIPKIKNNNYYIEIQNSILKDIFINIISSTTKDSKPELSGVLFDYQNSVIKFVSTDTFRLSEETILNNYFKSNIDNAFKIIIPLKTINEVIKETQLNESGKINIFFDQTQIVFKNENTEIISRLINGEFPEYQQIIPKTHETEVVLNKDELINAVKLVGIFTDRLNEIKITIKENLKNIEISSCNNVFGVNKYLISAKIKGEPIEVIFNWRFLLDGIKNITSENIFFGFSNSNKPAIIKSPEDTSYFYILMPIKS
ncbi:MAG: DNA polymerase III subunit beta [Patescibacteria group bacterium]